MLKQNKKLHIKIADHENSASYVECFLDMNATMKYLKCQTEIDFGLKSLWLKEVEQWKGLIKRIVYVILFFGEKSLGFRGRVKRCGDSRNGNFLGLLELLARFDPLLMSYIIKVKTYQEKGSQMAAYYLSPQSQNEFIDACGKLVQQKIFLHYKNA